VEIGRLVWYPANIAKLAGHGISRREVEQMVELDAWLPDRHPAYPDQVRIIGPTRAGRLLTIALAETDDPAAWRPVTGWPSDPSEEAYYYEEAR
jgi:hypothetical protein